MFSELTLRVFRVLFKYFATLSTPFKWNDELGAVEITKNKNQIWRSKFASSFQMSYAVFVVARLVQSRISDNVSIEKMIVQVPYFVIFSTSFFAELTILLRAPDLAYTFNQMRRNNGSFGKYRLPPKWDTFGILMFYLISSIVTFPYLCACFFFFNRDGHNFLYSLVNPSNQTEFLRISVIIIFLLVEIMSIHFFTSGVGVVLISILSYIMHSTHWINFRPEEYLTALGKKKIYKTFQILRLHTSRFNEAYGMMMLPLKDLLTVLVIIASFASIRFYPVLTLESLSLINFLIFCAVLILLVLFGLAGLIWKYSSIAKHQWRSANTMERQIHATMCPFGVMIGFLYVVKTHTFIALFHIIFCNICSLLIVFKN